MSKRDDADRQTIETQLAHCRRLLAAVSDVLADWRGRGGPPMTGLADVLLHTFMGRSTRIFEAIIHLGGRGFGEQAAMLNRSLFEDMVDARWVSLNRELAVERLRQHHRYSNLLKLDVAGGFPDFFGTDLPELDPPMTEDERQQLKGIFGTYGERSWTGKSLYERFAAIANTWEEELAKRHAGFFHLWVHRENNETVHPSAHSLANLGGPALVGESELHYMTGSTEHLLAQALFCAYWTYMQTVDLLFDSQIPDYERMYRELIEPGLVGVAEAMASARRSASDRVASTTADSS